MDLNQVTIPSLDLLRSIAFYQKLGLKLIVDSPPRYARFLCPSGGSTFSIHLVEQSVISAEGINIYFECQDLDREWEKLSSQGIKFLEPPTDRSWLWREARLKDPDGHMIILYYAGENRINPPWRVKE